MEVILGYLGRCLDTSSASSWCGGTDFRTLGTVMVGMVRGDVCISLKRCMGNQHIPGKVNFEDDCPFPKVGYVTSLEGMFFFWGGWCFFCGLYETELKAANGNQDEHWTFFDALQDDWAPMKTWCSHTYLYTVMYVHVAVSILYKHMSE